MLSTIELVAEIRRLARTGQKGHGYSDALAELRRRAAAGDSDAAAEIAATPSWSGVTAA